jgi:hypothetical protein
MKTEQHPILSSAAIQSGDRTLNSSIPRQWYTVAIGGLLFAAFLILLPSPVEAQCPQGWNISGRWSFTQSNQAVPNSLRLSVDGGGGINGLARYQTGGRATSVSGSVTGRVSGNDVQLMISWSNALVGIYSGQIDPQGTIRGTGYEKSSPSKRVSWSSDKPMICGLAPVQPVTGPRR